MESSMFWSRSEAVGLGESSEQDSATQQVMNLINQYKDISRLNDIREQELHVTTQKEKYIKQVKDETKEPLSKTYELDQFYQTIEELIKFFEGEGVITCWLEQFKRVQAKGIETSLLDKFEIADSDSLGTNGHDEQLSDEMKQFVKDLEHYYDAKLYEYSKENIAGLENQLATVRRELLELEEIHTEELQQLNKQLENVQNENRAALHVSLSETLDEECLEIIRKTDENNLAAAQLDKQNNEMEQTLTDREVEYQQLRQELAQVKQISVQLQQDIENLKEEKVFVENTAMLAEIEKKKEATHLAQGNGVFAQLEDRKKIYQRKLEHVNKLLKQTLDDENNWKAKLANKRIEVDKFLSNLRSSRESGIEQDEVDEYRAKLEKCNLEMEALLAVSSNDVPYENDMHENYNYEQLSHPYPDIIEYNHRQKVELESKRKEVYEMFQQQAKYIDDIYNGQRDLVRLERLWEENDAETQRLMTLIQQATANKQKLADELPAVKNKKKVTFTMSKEIAEGSDEIAELGSLSIKAKPVSPLNENNTNDNKKKREKPKLKLCVFESRVVTEDELDAMPDLVPLPQIFPVSK